jgi:hypothetical protein
MHWKLEEILQEANARVRESAAKHVGREVFDFVRNHLTPFDLLRSADAKVRFAVVANALEIGEMSQAVADQCEALSRADTDPFVRGIALTYVSTFYSKKENRRIAALLATVVCDATEREDVRLAAYSGLGRMGKEYDLSHSLVAAGFSFSGIDWNFVRSFLGDP